MAFWGCHVLKCKVLLRDSTFLPLIYNPKTLNLQTDSSLFADTHEHLLPEARIRRSRELVQQLRPIIQGKTTQNHRIISILNR
jgi:hypothetical protein